MYFNDCLHQSFFSRESRVFLWRQKNAITLLLISCCDYTLLYYLLYGDVYIMHALYIQGVTKNRPLCVYENMSAIAGDLKVSFYQILYEFL